MGAALGTSFRRYWVSLLPFFSVVSCSVIQLFSCVGPSTGSGALAFSVVALRHREARSDPEYESFCCVGLSTGSRTLAITKAKVPEPVEGPFYHKKLCKDDNFSEKNAFLCKPNFIKMKRRIAIALLIAFVSGIIMASCGSNKTCPAYGESSKYVKETRY